MSKKFKFLKGRVREYVKFNIIGMINFVVSQLFYITLHLVFSINYIIAYTITSVLSVIASYILNSKFTFKQNNYCATKFSLSILVYIFEYIFNMGIIIFLVNSFDVSKILAPLIAPVFSTIPAFFLMRAVIKRKSKKIK